MTWNLLNYARPHVNVQNVKKFGGRKEWMMEGFPWLMIEKNKQTNNDAPIV